MFEKLREAFRSFVERVSTTALDEGKVSPILDELFLALVESDVAVEVAEHICEELKRRMSGVRVGRFQDPRPVVVRLLREVLRELLSKEGPDVLSMAEEKRKRGEPLVVVFVGVNGSGKTTTIAKFAHMFLKQGFTVVLACSDTFRAGAIEQLAEHARRLGVPMISHQYGSDPAAVAYDAVAYARSRGFSVVLVDTAGRMQTDANLMEEMRKIVRVAEADLVIFVGDALAGNDAVDQARRFHEAVGFDGAVLTKMDADAKGGAALSIAYVTGKPILFIGVGQRYEDLVPFDPSLILDRVLPSD